jgi:hypothetical protein
MNCAKITVTGNGQGFDGPDLFVANLGAVNTVKTQLGSDVIFPDPGPNVEFGGDGKRAPPIGVEVASDALGPTTSVASNNVISTTIPLDVGGPSTLFTSTTHTMMANATTTESARKTKKKHHHHGPKLAIANATKTVFATTTMVVVL